MDKGLHFISGLPRSGSTLLAAIFRQNPHIHSGMSSPVGGVFMRVLKGMGPGNEFSTHITDVQRRNVLRGLFDNFYQEIHPNQLVVDTNRLWCSKMPAIAELFPDAKVIVCVRPLAWVLDSFERALRKNPLLVSNMFKPQGGGGATVHSRVNALSSPNGTVGFAWNAVQEAFYGEHADRIIVMDYEALTREPQKTIDAIYKTLGLPSFAHDFDNVVYDEGAEFDAQLGVPGLHAVKRKVSFIERPTILPPELFERFVGRNFWRRPGGNPRGATVLLPAAVSERAQGAGQPAPGARMMHARRRGPVAGV
jgi:sulfotransferase